MDSELFDILDENGEPSGRTCTRKEAHEQGIYHRTAHIWLVSGNSLLLQKRSSIKDSFPGCWDISSAGHLTAGTDYAEGAVRELYEELGIKAEESELYYIGSICRNITADFGEKPFHDREKAAVFVYTGSFDTDTLKLQEEEVEAVQLFDIDFITENIDSKELPNCLDINELNMLRQFITERK